MDHFSLQDDGLVLSGTLYHNIAWFLRDLKEFVVKKGKDRAGRMIVLDGWLALSI